AVEEVRKMAQDNSCEKRQRLSASRVTRRDFQALRRGYIRNLKHGNHLDVTLTEERDVLVAMEKFEKEKIEAAKFLAVWGNNDSPDIGDVCEKLSKMSSKLGEIFGSLHSKYGEYRHILKEIKQDEDEVWDLRKKHSDCEDKFKSHSKAGKPIVTIEAEMKTLENDLLKKEADQISEKRKKLKTALMLQFEGWLNFGAKV
ncbi:hypothetical protein HK096_011483, partial [Nowakowskiella sp. JEL0078]